MFPNALADDHQNRMISKEVIDLIRIWKLGATVRRSLV